MDRETLLRRLASGPDDIVQNDTIRPRDVPDEIFPEFREARALLDEYNDVLRALEDAATTLLLSGDSDDTD